jgi:hypothetical protein
MSHEEPPSYGNPPEGPPAGWYPDPNDLPVLRWWDGRQWGPQTQAMPAGQEPQRPDPDIREDAVSPPGPATGPSSASIPPDQPDPLRPQGWPQRPDGQGPHPTPPGPQHGQGPRKPWTARRHTVTVIAASAAVLVLVAIIASIVQAGNSGGAPSAAAGSPSAAAGSPSTAAGSQSASAPPCTTHSCIVAGIEQSLPGQTAKDGSVITKAVCYKSTVKDNPGDTYTVSCDVTYSDGEVWSELVTFLAASDQITWEPENEL